jgi:acyl-CoA reductase-like NAD-dependent aldehyde dehydrogenase
MILNMTSTAHAIHQVTGPAAEAVLGEVALTAPESVAAIVGDAREAQREWSRRPAVERAECLERAAEHLAGDVEPLGHLLAAESGKPLAQAMGEVAGAVALLRGNAIEGRRLGGRVLPTEGLRGTEWDLAYTRREPLGVVGAILPFNFPAELFVEKGAAALMAGNAVVVKPPLEDPLVVERLHAAVIAAGVPPAACALAHGGREVGAALAESAGVDAISLTGSSEAGAAVALAAAPSLRRLHLELGGNNACVVLPDADLDLLADELAFGRLMMNGQACSASKRVIVPPELAAEVTERLVAVARAQVVGPATDAETTIGPLITPAAAERVGGQIRRACAEGARIAIGDGVPEGPYLAPAVLTGVPGEAAVARDDEIFGPVFVVIPAPDTDAAVRIANGSSFGLMASVFSEDLGRALRVAERLEAGGVVINGTDNYRPPVIPFHGVKRSGAGREGLGYTLEELSREKTVVLRRVRQEDGSRT